MQIPLDPELPKGLVFYEKADKFPWVIIAEGSYCMFEPFIHAYSASSRYFLLDRPESKDYKWQTSVNSQNFKEESKRRGSLSIVVYHLYTEPQFKDMCILLQKERGDTLKSLGITLVRTTSELDEFING